MYSLSRMAGWYDGRPVASGTTPPKPSALRSSASTKASMTRTGLFSSTQSSRLSGNRVVWLRSTPSTKRLIGSPKQGWAILPLLALSRRQRFDTTRVNRRHLAEVREDPLRPSKRNLGQDQLRATCGLPDRGFDVP